MLPSSLSKLPVFNVSDECLAYQKSLAQMSAEDSNFYASDNESAPTTSVTAAAVVNNEKNKRVSKKRDYLRVTSLTLVFIVIATGASIRIPCIHTTIALGKTIGNLVIGTRGYCFTVPGTPEKCTSDPLGQLLSNHPT